MASPALRSALASALSASDAPSIVDVYASASSFATAVLDAPAPAPDVIALSVQDLSLLALLHDVVVSRVLLPFVVEGGATELDKAVRARFARSARALLPLGGSADCVAASASAAAATGAHAESITNFAREGARLVAHAEMDLRMVDRALPDVLAALLLASRIADDDAQGMRSVGAGTAFDSATFMHLRAVLPAQALVLALMRIAAGEAPASPSCVWLRFRAGAALTRLVVLPRGVAGVLEAFLSGASSADADSIVRATERAAAVIASPSLESGGDARGYFAAIAPQLRELLRAPRRDAFARALANAAVRVVARILATSQAPAVAPLLHELFGAFFLFCNPYAGGCVPDDGPLVEETAVATATEDALAICVAEPLRRGAADTLRPIIPGLFALALAAGSSRLHTQMGTAAREALGVLICALAPDVGAEYLARLARLEISTASDDSRAATMLTRSPHVAFVRGGSAGIELRYFSAAVDEDGTAADGIRGIESSGDAGDPARGAVEALARAAILADILSGALARNRRRGRSATTVFFCRLLLAAVSSLDPRNSTPAHVRVRILHTFLALSERLGPKALRGDADVIKALRSALALAAAASGLHVPDAVAAGCGAGSPAARIAAAGRVAPSEEPPPAEVVAELAELAAACVGLLSLIVLGEDDEEETAEGAGSGDACVDARGDGDSDAVDAADAGSREDWLRSTLPLLAAYSSHADGPLSVAATALRALILCGAAAPTPVPANAPAAETRSRPSSLSPVLDMSRREALALVVDPEPAVLSAGLRALARTVAREALSTPSPDASIENSADAEADAALLELAISHSSSEDAIVGAGAVELARALTTAQPRLALPRLLRVFVDDAAPPRTRARIGETLTRVARGAGNAGTLSFYAPALLGACARVGVGGWRLQEDAARLAIEATDDRARFDALTALDTAATLRSSALSCLGQVASALPHAVGGRAPDVLAGLQSTLRERAHVSSTLSGPKRDVEDSIHDATVAAIVDASARVRRAAALAARLVLEGPDATAALARAGLMREYYAALSVAASSDPDAIARAHANDALATVDAAMSAMLAPAASARMPKHWAKSGASLPDVSLSYT